MKELIRVSLRTDRRERIGNFEGKYGSRSHLLVCTFVMKARFPHQGLVSWVQARSWAWIRREKGRSPFFRFCCSFPPFFGPSPSRSLPRSCAGNQRKLRELLVNKNNCTTWQFVQWSGWRRWRDVSSGWPPLWSSRSRRQSGSLWDRGRPVTRWPPGDDRMRATWLHLSFVSFGFEQRFARIGNSCDPHLTFWHWQRISLLLTE